MPKKLDIEALPIGLTRIDTGLYIRKRQPPRKPMWLCVYFWGGKRREKSLGSYPDTGITAARSKADKIRDMVERGIDPVQAQKDFKAALAKEHGEKAYTFSQLVEDALPVIEETKHWRNAKSAAQWRATIDTYAIPIIGKKPVREITRDDILEVLRPIWKTKTETASRLRGRLEAIFSFAIVSGKYSGTNPCLWRGGLALLLPARSKVAAIEHQEAVSLTETKDMIASLDLAKLSTGWAAILFGILTCARVNEFARAKWSEIDMAAAVWSCPRRKDGKDYPHRVPLSKQAILLLRGLEKTSDYIFPASIKASGHLNLETPRMLIKKKLKHGTMHGFRSTFRDWAAEAGIDRVLAEKSLMHATGTAVEQAYQRSDLLEQRRPVLQRWADEILPLDA